MAVNDIYEVSLLYSLNGEKCANVIHVKEITAPTSTPAEDDIAAAVVNTFWASIKSVLSNDLNLQQVRVRRVDPTPGGNIIRVEGDPGGVSQDTLPPNNCLVATFYTDEISRNGRGRIHLPGIPETYVADGLLLAANAPAIQAQLDTLLLNMSASAPDGLYRAVVFSKTTSTGYLITRIQLRSWIHTLRGRRMIAP